jgi:hypothetical protein
MLITEIRFAQDITAAMGELGQAGGHVTQQLTGTAFIAALPDTFNSASLQQSTSVLPADADSVTKLANGAWMDYQAQRSRSQEAISFAAQPWDAPDTLPPAPFEQVEPMEGTDRAEATLTGSVTLGLVITGGETEALRVTETQQRTILREVMQGVDWLTLASPEPLRFVYQISLLTISAEPLATKCAEYEPCEAVWRDPALKQLGYGAGIKGYRKYAADLRKNNKTDWAYLTFFTSYPQKHHAYANSIRVCMLVNNKGGGGSAKINKTFTHETLHIFGAKDEYGKEGNSDNPCTCSASGRDNVPNNNCINCTGNRVPCIMHSIEDAMCKYTKGQIGWGYEPEPV